MESNDIFQKIVKQSVDLPIVHVDRKTFLQKELGLYLTSEKINLVLEKGTRGVVDKKLIDKIARGCINFQTSLVCGTSFISGIPGGWAMLGTIPTDVIQFYGNVFCITQKLLYLYGYPELSGENGKLTDENCQLLIVFIGAMMGLQGAEAGVKIIADSLAKSTQKKIAVMVLRDSTIYQIAKKVAAMIGVKLTRDGFAKMAGKVIPLVGAPISASMTYFTFYPMCKKLKKLLDDQWNNSSANW